MVKVKAFLDADDKAKVWPTLLKQSKGLMQKSSVSFFIQ